MSVAIAWIGTLMSSALSVLILFAGAMKTAPGVSAVSTLLAALGPAVLAVLLAIAASRAGQRAEWPKATLGFTLPLLINVATLLLVLSSSGGP